MSEHEDPLKDAFRALRETHEGEHPEVDATLTRVLFQTRKRERSRSVARYVLLPAAAMLIASTAFAGMTGRLAPVIDAVMDTLGVGVGERHPDAPTSAPRQTAPVASAPEAPAPLASAPPEPPPPPIATTPAPVAAQPEAPRVVTSAPKKPAELARREPTEPKAPLEATAPAVTPPAPSAATREEAQQAEWARDPHGHLFAEAHRLHFVDKDPARALGAWDRYLAAAPSGRFAPEARYNRALTLVRVGRLAEAKQELSAFASGSYGDYRKKEARALIDAIDADASAGSR